MRKEQECPRLLDRRRLLRGASLAVGAALAEHPAVAVTENSKPQHRGYRESEEVKVYYKRARF